jgi:hypothetical protein
MVKRWFFGLALAGSILTSIPAAVVGERPAVETHLDQLDIETGALTFEEILGHGQAMFLARFNTMDGQGRPATMGNGMPRVADEPRFNRTSGPDASSCLGCHDQPREGGSGAFERNAFVVAEELDPVTYSIEASISNERNPPSLFGTGPVEMLAREMSLEMIALRQEALFEAEAFNEPASRELVTKGVHFGTITVYPDGTVDPSGIEGVDWDLIIKPFHQTGANVSVRQFAVGALNRHFGIQAAERFGIGSDPDDDGVTDEATIGDVTSIALWVAALNTPGQAVPEDPAQRLAMVQGEALFSTIGCADCHRTSMNLESPLFSEPSPLNPGDTLSLIDVAVPYTFDMTTQGPEPRLPSNGAGGATVRAFTDLKRHNLNDAEVNHFANEQVPQGFLTGFAPSSDFTIAPEPRSTELFMTGRLWTVGSSDPYGHRGDLPMLTEAILAHGGEARPQREAFLALADEEQNAIVEFLRSLQVVPDGAPIGPAPVMSIDPPFLAFGNQVVDVGETTPADLTIANVGTDDLEFASITLSGPGAADFRIASDSGESSLAPGESRSVSVSFDPESLGIVEADLVIVSNAHAAPAVAVPLLGGGSLPTGESGLATVQIRRAILGQSVAPPPVEKLDVNTDTKVDSADIVTNENFINSAP